MAHRERKPMGRLPRRQPAHRSSVGLEVGVPYVVAIAVVMPLVLEAIVVPATVSATMVIAEPRGG